MGEKTLKRVRTKSTRKREARENVEALEREKDDKKAGAKARKALREEAADDDLLVEHEGESSDTTKLCVLTLKLSSENERLKAKLSCDTEQEPLLPAKIIPEPRNKGDINIETIRELLDITGDEGAIEWSMTRQDFRNLLLGGGLDWDQSWSKQSYDRKALLYQAAVQRCPKMKRFANYWGVEFLFKECYGNLLSYHRKLIRLHENSASPDDTLAPTNPLAPTDTVIPADNGGDEPWGRAQRAAAHKAAAHRAFERKAQQYAGGSSDD